MNLHSTILNNATTYPEKTALLYFNRSISYGKLANSIKHYISLLYEMGAREGDIVTVSLPTTPESIAITYSLNYIGATVNFVDVRSTPEQVSNSVRATKSKLLFIMNFNTKRIASMAKEMAVEHIVVLRGVESLPLTVQFGYSVVDYINGRHHLSNSDKRFVYWSNITKRKNTFEAPAYKWPQDAPQLIFQTSGTTGKAKMAMITAENISNATSSFPEIARNLCTDDIVLGTIPIFTLTGFETSVHFPLFYGATSVIIPIWKVANYIKLIEKYKPHHIWSVPSYWDTINDTNNSDVNLSSLKTAVVFGDIITPDFEKSINKYLREHGHNHIIKKIYGMTETAGIVTLTDDSDTNTYTNGFSGKVKANHKIKIVNNEICVHTATKTLGYYANPEASSFLLRQHNDGLVWLHTGDFGHTDDEGNLYIDGRIKRMIVRSDGTKIFPIEIESVLTRHPKIKECTVIGIPDKDHQQSMSPIAFITLKQNCCENTNEFLKYAKKMLPHHLHPSKIFIIPRIPLTNAGKTDYQKLISYIK